MKIEWTPVSLRHREDIWLHIAGDNVSAAFDMDERISRAVGRLLDFPELGRLGEVPNTRELFPHENYRLIYRITPQVITIIAVVHVARQWPPVNEEHL